MIGLGERLVPVQLLLINRSDHTLYYESYGKKWETGSSPRIKRFRIVGGRRQVENYGCLSGLTRESLQAGEEQRFRLLLGPHHQGQVLQVVMKSESGQIEYAETEWN